MNKDSHSHNTQHKSLLQKTYGNPKPVREYKRFNRHKIADTGSDPNGARIEFIKHDIIRPLERPNHFPIIENKSEQEKWALGTTKQAMALENLPKVQQFREYNFKTKSEEQPCHSSLQKTDHISIRIPEFKHKNEQESYLNMKNKMGSHTETFKEAWIPQGNFKTMNNRSSVTYNIISCDKNETSGAIILKMMDTKLNNKKKGVTEFSDLTRLNNPNINKKFRGYYEENNKIFNVYNGIFSHMYDAAHRNGNIVVPFRNSLVPPHVGSNKNTNSPKRDK